MKAEWPKVRLGECTEIVSGATPSTSVEFYWNGDVCWATPKDLSELDGAYISDTPRKLTRAGLDNCGAAILPAGSVLFSSRAPIGHVAVNTVPIATNQGFKSFIPKPESVDAKFLYWWLRTNRPYLESLGNGATFKEVSKATVSRIEIPLPSLAEQRRIAEVLDRVDALRAKRHAFLAQINSFTQSIFLDLFGDPVTNPMQWPMQDLHAVLDLITYGLTVRPEYVLTGVPLISAKEIRSGMVDMGGAAKISQKDFDVLSNKAKPVKGDILFSKTGSIGHAALVSSNYPIALAQNAARLTFKRVLVDEVYALYYLRTGTIQRLAQRSARGNAVKDLQLGVLQKFPFPLPPIELQREFASRIGAVEKLKAAQRASLAELDALFASLQHRAFKGELFSETDRESLVV